MNLSEPIAALEIGTTQTVIAIGEPLSGGRVKVAALSSIPSAGVRKSQITDIPQARYSIESVLKHLYDQANYSIGQAYLAVSGPQIRTKVIKTQIPINGFVCDEDLDNVDNLSYEAGLAQDRTPIELSQICYSLDDVDNINSPKGMSGRALTLRSLCIHGSTARITDARKAAHDAKLELQEDVFFAGTCAAAAVLTYQNKKDGALVIDLGGGSTSFTTWCDGKLVQAGVIGVGGDHLTNDIRVAFSVSQAQAEHLKTTDASAVITVEDAKARVSVPDPMPGFTASTISRRALNTVVNARLQELFAIIRQQLDDEGLLHRLNAGVVLTGGGAALRGAVELATSVFGCGVRVGSLLPEIEGLEKEPFPAACAVIAGLLLLAQPKDVSSNGIFASIKNIFSRNK
ncbi:MAG: cell division protein FtsA [Kiritimatiellae bacterium]|nr:cell division protein FtsA [Kiritimatiellia bacterium]